MKYCVIVVEKIMKFNGKIVRVICICDLENGKKIDEG